MQDAGDPATPAAPGAETPDAADRTVIVPPSADSTAIIPAQTAPIAQTAPATQATPATQAGQGYGPFHNGPAPTSGAPAWTAAPPSDGPVDAYGLPVTPSSDAGLDQYGLGPSSGAPRFGPGSKTSNQPSQAPSSGAPRFGEPADQYGLGPSSGAPRFGEPADQYGLGPSSGAPRFDPGGDVLSPRGGPRIEPSPPRRTNKRLLAGLAAGLLLVGAAGFFVGRETAPKAAPTTPTAAPSAPPSLGVYEQSQVALNQAKLTGALAPVAQGWLPYLSSCEKNGEPGGPVLNKGEKARVRCRLDGMSAIFVEYATVTDRDKARVKTLSQNVDARTLTPGVGPAGDRAAPSGRTSGSYVEYAYTVTENRAKQTVAGVWWDDTKAPVAAYLLAFWKSGLGEDWAPMRDVWGRYA